jgi:hypothetical protein
MTTTEVGLYALQCNGIAATIRSKYEGNNIVDVLMTNGDITEIVCPNAENAVTVLNTILYLPIQRENAGHEFKFEVKIKVLKQ